MRSMIRVGAYVLVKVGGLEWFAGKLRFLNLTSAELSGGRRLLSWDRRIQSLADLCTNGPAERVTLKLDAPVTVCVQWSEIILVSKKAATAFRTAPTFTFGK